MALRARSLFLYGYEVTELNRSIDFKATSGGVELLATLRLGFYSLTSLLAEIKYAMETVDFNGNLYTVAANRTIAGGTQNRVTITTNGAFLSLFFLTGSRSASSVCGLIGFAKTDRTGALTYTGTLTSGIVLQTDPNFHGSDYKSPALFKENKGVVNKSASGRKEAIVFRVTSMWAVRYKYISESDTTAWANLLTWMIGQRMIEWTPEVTSPNVFHIGTLESTSDNSNGLGFNLQEMTPAMVGLYDTGILKFLVSQ